jgi:hypothetical protein
MQKTVKQVVDEYNARQESTTFESVVITDGNWTQRYEQVTNFVQYGDKIEFDYNMPFEVNHDIEARQKDIFKRRWVHKEFFGATVREKCKFIGN